MLTRKGPHRRRQPRNVFLLASGFLWLSPAMPAAVPDDGPECVRVSPDGAHFETSASHQIFIPFGGIYFDPETYTEKPFPRFLLITGFDAGRTRRHFEQISTIGANIIRISLSTGVFSPEYGECDPGAFDTLDRIIGLARDNNLRVVLDLMVEWEGRAEWIDRPWELFTDETALSGLEFLYAAIARRYRNNPTVFSYLLCDEAKIPWESTGIHAEWAKWVHAEYGTEEKLMESWPGYPWSKETWEHPIPPSDQNSAGSRRLYDYQRYREDIAARFVSRLAKAIRDEDPNHMISVGLLQWNVPLRPPIDDEKLLKPSSYPAFNPHKIAQHVDYIHVNCYNWWDSKTAHYARALGSYCSVSGKPVLLGEFSFDPIVVEKTRDLFAGYFAWAFYPLPSEPAHHYLFTADAKPTSHAGGFRETATKIADGGRIPTAQAPQSALVIDATQAFTDIPSNVRIYEQYMRLTHQRGMVAIRPSD
jgi:hypothetical protein